MMKTIKASIGAGKTTTLVKMLNELEGKTLLIQNEMKAIDIKNLGYKGDLYTTGIAYDVYWEERKEECLNDLLFLDKIKEFKNVGIDLMGLHGAVKEDVIKTIQQLEQETGINFIVTEQVSYAGEKVLEVV